MKQGLTYADVLIVPQYSNIDTRDDIDVTSPYLGQYRLPFISAPMDYVTGENMANAMYKEGGYGIINRFGGDAVPVGSGPSQIGLSIGTKTIAEALNRIEDYEPHSVCIDVAHGHHNNVSMTIAAIASEFPSIYIIAGNVATSAGMVFLFNSGAHAVRVGIGPGSACSTRENTGVGVPQLTAILDIVRRKQENALDIDIIADGGIQNPGDIAKALAAGAGAVMLGRMLAGHDECPGTPVNGRRPYQGQSLLGSNGARNAPEGVAGWVEEKGPVKNTIEQLTNYLKSSFSYVGARNIQEFKERAEFIQVSPGTFRESETRL